MSVSDKSNVGTKDAEEEKRFMDITIKEEAGSEKRTVVAIESDDNSTETSSSLGKLIHSGNFIIGGFSTGFLCNILCSLTTKTNLIKIYDVKSVW